jgi:anti-sigma28 factor (negative regulator of flagellin synthesis)
MRTELKAHGCRGRKEAKLLVRFASDQSTPRAATPVGEVELSMIVAHWKLASDIRTEKVIAIRQSISAGTYNVSSAEMATKLISILSSDVSPGASITTPCELLPAHTND